MGGSKEAEGSRQELISESGWQQKEASHKELVDRVQRFIQDEQKCLRETRSPEEIIHSLLEQEWQSRPLHTEKLNKERVQFLFQLLKAWDAIAYNRYELGSKTEQTAGSGLSRFYQHIQAIGEKPMIRLSPVQVQIIDVLTEAVGILYQKEQSEIEIPEYLKHYSKWLQSPEYQDRVAQAKKKKQVAV